MAADNRSLLFSRFETAKVLEQIKNSLPKHIAVHLNQQEVMEVHAAAEMADNYDSMHQGPWMADKPLVSPRQFEEKVKKEGKSERNCEAPGG